jgi:dihydrofolate synthase/folylpolyglutamate synthase
MNDRYLNVLTKLYNTNRFKSKKVNLDAIIKGCELFNNPQKSLNLIHVTGTNGKGSVCKKLASIFTKSGMKTGLFISPHISSFRERIQIDNKYIDKEYVTLELEKIYKVLEQNNCELTYFEIVTLLCFNYYRDMKIDIGVIEVGIGGNLDATNIFDPLLSIITSIGMDHMDSLGYTLKEIAEKKAGIIKYKKPSLIGIDCNPIEVFIDRAKEVESDIYSCSDQGLENLNKFKNDPKSYYDSKKILTKDNFDVNYEKENNNTVKFAIQILKEYYYEIFGKITEDDIKYGLLQKQPCRKEDVFEQIPKEIISKIFKNSKFNLVNKIFLDVAHNAHAMAKLLPQIREEFPKCKIHLICGFSSSKDKDEMFKIICSYADKIYLTAPLKHPRTTSYETLKNELQTWLLNFKYDIQMFPDLNNNMKSYKGEVKEAIEKCINEVEDETIIIVCGTFFIMKDARKTFGYDEEEDPVELNEINPTKFKV